MPVQFALPDLGENIESGDVIRILVDVGDRLAEDQTVIELETDKAVIEVPSSIDGTVTGILIQQGDTIAVGQPILEVEAAAAQPPRKQPQRLHRQRNQPQLQCHKNKRPPRSSKEPLPRLLLHLQTAPSQPRHRRDA